MSIAKPTMRVAQVTRPGGPLELVERPIPDPGPGSVRIKVQACGICHSDAMTDQWFQSLGLVNLVQRYVTLQP